MTNYFLVHQETGNIHSRCPLTERLMNIMNRNLIGFRTGYRWVVSDLVSRSELTKWERSQRIKNYN